MENKVFSFNVKDKYIDDELSVAIKKLTKNEIPIIVCVGSDLVLGDSLGPLVGTFLSKKGLKTYVYGTLKCPVTAKEARYVKDYILKTHPDKKVIVVDAAVGKMEDVGVVRVANRGVKPGLGVEKNLEMIGDMSIVGVVAEKTKENFKLFNLTRLSFVYRMAESIAKAILMSVGDENVQKNVI